MPNPDPFSAAECHAHHAACLVACLDTMHELMSAEDWARQKNELGALIGSIRVEIGGVERSLETAHALKVANKVRNI